MNRSIRTLEWKGPTDDQFIDVTDALAEDLVSATPHPDEAIDRPKGYSVELTDPYKRIRRRFCESGGPWTAASKSRASRMYSRIGTSSAKTVALECVRVVVHGR